MSSPRQAYPSDVRDDEWAYLLPYLTLMREDGERLIAAGITSREEVLRVTRD